MGSQQLAHANKARVLRPGVTRESCGSDQPDAAESWGGLAQRRGLPVSPLRQCHCEYWRGEVSIVTLLRGSGTWIRVSITSGYRFWPSANVRAALISQCTM